MKKKVSVLFLLVALCSISLGKEISAFDSLEFVGSIKPKKSTEVMSSSWGVQAGSTSDSVLQKASELGVKWTRLHASWEHIEPTKGVYNWKKNDVSFDSVLKLGITPFVTLGNGNRIYSGTGAYDDPKLAAIYGKSPAPPVGSQEELDAWLRYVTATVERYKDRIIYWEIWNEPNHRKFWGAPPSGEDYGKLVKATAERIRSIHPKAKIIAGSMAGMDSVYLDSFLSECDPHNIDIISFHNYATLPECRINLSTKFLEVINSHNPDLEIWQGECGFPSHSRTTGYRARAPWGLNIQAKWLLRQSFVDTFYCKATLSNYFWLYNGGSANPKPRPDGLSGMEAIIGFPEREGARVHSSGANEKCILFARSVNPKPAFYAYQNLCASMDGSYKAFKTTYKVDVNDQGMFYGIGRHEDAFPSVPLVVTYKDARNQPFVAYWLPWNPQEYTPNCAEISLQIDKIEFKEPVLLNLLNGHVYKIKDYQVGDSNSVIFKSLPLIDAPFAIVEQSAINVLIY